MKKKIKTCILSILLSLSCLCGSIYVANAAVNRVYDFLYGECTTMYEEHLNVADGYYCYNIINVNLNNVYSGNFNINWSYTNGDPQHDMSIWNVIIDGGTIAAISNSQLRIKVLNTNFVQIILCRFVSGSHTSQEFIFTSITNNSLTVSTTSDNYYLKDIDAMLHGTTNGTLSSMLSDLDSIKSNSVQLMMDTNSIITLLAPLANNVSDILTKVNSINNNLSSLLNAVNNMDNSLDTITFNNLVPIAGYTSDFNNITTLPATIASGYIVSNPIVFNYSTAFQNRQSIIKFQLPINRSSSTNYHLYLRNETTGALSSIDNCVLYTTQNRVRTIYYIDLNKTSNNYYNATDGYRFVLQFTAASTTYVGTPGNITYITDEDIEYFTMMNIFNQYDVIKNQTNLYSLVNTLNSSVLAGNTIEQNIYNRLQDVIDAINQISITVDQDTQIVINNYNDIYTDVHDIEVNFISQFNSSNNNVDLTNKSVMDNLVQARNYISLRLDKIMTIPYIEPILYLLLVSVVVVCILG